MIRDPHMTPHYKPRLRGLVQGYREKKTKEGDHRYDRKSGSIHDPMIPPHVGALKIKGNEARSRRAEHSQLGIKEPSVPGPLRTPHS